MDNLKDVLEGLQIGWTTTINEKKESRAAQQDFKNIAPDGVYTAILNAEIRNTPKPAVLFKLTILDNEYKDQKTVIWRDLTRDKLIFLESDLSNLDIDITDITILPDTIIMLNDEQPKIEFS